MIQACVEIALLELGPTAPSENKIQNPMDIFAARYMLPLAYEKLTALLVLPMQVLVARCVYTSAFL